MKALIFGAGGQDGFYLTKHLLSLGYQVYAVLRRSSVDNTQRLGDFRPNPNFDIVRGDVTDYSSVYSIINRFKVDEIYNLAGQSSVGLSFQQPIYTFNSISNGCLNILEAIRVLNPRIKFYQASSGEMFGTGFSIKKNLDGTTQKFQNESTPMLPQSPYGVAKLSAHNLVNMYRNTYGLFACSGILYNHESPIRGEEFVTRKITKWIGDFSHWVNHTSSIYPGCRYVKTGDVISLENNSAYTFPKLRLGSIHIKRDWGHAEDYVKSMHLMLQYYMPDDYVVATGKLHSIKDFIEEAFSHISIINPLDYVVIDPVLYRPADVDYVYGDATKARFILRWQPKHTFSSIVKEMVESDILNAEKERPAVEAAGFIKR